MIKAAFKTDRGRTRPINEDSLLCLSDERLYMVADGVGGHNAGEIASSLATEMAAVYVKHHPLRRVRNDEELKQYFLDCLREANESVVRVANQRDAKAGMATTALICYIATGKAYMVNVGDSRGYLVRDGKMMQVTEDHTYVNQLIKEGNLTPEEAADHPNKHVITRALGAGSKLEPDFFQFEVYGGDRILLCTDGLYNEVPEEEICRLVSAAQSVEALAKELVNRAGEYGGRDNITVVCIEIPG